MRSKLFNRSSCSIRGRILAKSRPMSGIRTHRRTGLAAWWMKALHRKLQRVWLDLPLRGKGLVVVSLPIVALIAGLILLSAMATQEQDAQQWVDHTTEVRGNLHAI